MWIATTIQAKDIQEVIPVIQPQEEMTTIQAAAAEPEEEVQADQTT
jgi:hypothetical protein